MDVAILGTARFAITEPAAAGLEVHTRVLATALLARGHDVTVYAAGGDGPFDVGAMRSIPLREDGGDDWALAAKAFNNGAVLVHEARPVAWHDRPDWTERSGDGQAHNG